MVPLIWLGVTIQDPATPYGVMVAIAALCGIGGANFASSLADIGFFFPKARKGGATGVNGGLGNVSRVDILPFRKLGEAKWRSLAKPFTPHGTPSPTPGQLASARHAFAAHGLRVV
ncbi:hypothetical protein [Streptomyces sp. NK15101]|uniref:hypothetical protein n=1 Tax=Streptomyces sp. NK15101 TaxID=2873261 RepID=UPI001CEC6098|nr:hypothetical protein [Streptomyces sp. NK15101]